MLVKNLKKPVSADLEAVDELIISSLSAEISLVQDVVKHIVQGGGKRLRPLLVLLCAKACGYQGKNQITMAAVIEFIHTATLLHDDVVDVSMLRRGNDTANKIWGNETAILVGDFLYSRAFQMMVDIDNNKIMRIIANTTNTMATGEVMQMLHQHNANTSETQYLNMIRSKTAKLFEAATEIGAVLAGTDAHIQNSLAQYGLHLGTAYQLIDDLLDYQADNSDFGKQVGIDFAAGKPTMPLIYLAKHGTEAQKKLVNEVLQNPGSIELSEIQQAINDSQALQYTLKFAQREVDLAKQALSELAVSEFRTAALELADFVVHRSY